MPLICPRAPLRATPPSTPTDCISNSLRVLKTTRQTSAISLSYTAAATAIIAKDGVAGLMGRGLQTRLLVNGIQSSLFVILWKIGEEHLARRGL